MALFSSTRKVCKYFSPGWSGVGDDGVCRRQGVIAHHRRVGHLLKESREKRV